MFDDLENILAMVFMVDNVTIYTLQYRPIERRYYISFSVAKIGRDFIDVYIDAERKLTLTDLFASLYVEMKTRGYSIWQ